MYRSFLFNTALYATKLLPFYKVKYKHTKQDAVGCVQCVYFKFSYACLCQKLAKLDNIRQSYHRYKKCFFETQCYVSIFEKFLRLRLSFLRAWRHRDVRWNITEVINTSRVNGFRKHTHIHTESNTDCAHQLLSLIHIWRCRRIERCRSRWSPYH